MWLINTTTLKLKSFVPPHFPKYAILSHTWGEDEVTFQDFQDLETARLKRGFAKIEKTCQIARGSDLEYAWVDTCCIDKTSSAELSESINSMYSWYQHAEICYAYINDWNTIRFTWINLPSIVEDDEPEANRSESYTEPDEMRKWTSEKDNAQRVKFVFETLGLPPLTKKPLRWFTRSWTLQELIAPKVMEFYDSEWELKGSKSDPEVIEHLSRITGIDPGVLKDGSERNLRGVCLGQRMSWAAFRETSRVEDIAYSLLGIFQINMPLLYGEGNRAFSRLQEEIVKSSTDLSILAWRQEAQELLDFRGIFAEQPKEFKRLGGCHLEDSQFSRRDEVLMTNKGARIRTSLFEPFSNITTERSSSDCQILYLGCYVSGHLQGIAIQNVKDFYVRAYPSELTEITSSVRRAKTQTIYLARDKDAFSGLNYGTAFATGVRVDFFAPDPYVMEIREAWPPGLYDHQYRRFLGWGRDSSVGFLAIDLKSNVIGHAEKRQVAHFVAVCQWQGSELSERSWLRLVDFDQTADFCRFARALYDSDPVTAKQILSASFTSIAGDLKRELIVTDGDEGNELCVRAVKTDTCMYSLLVDVYSDQHLGQFA